jgi:outer membrane biosynthesis protein TonB
LKNVASVQLSPSNTNLDEVVVTTLDVRKKAAEKFPSLDDSTTAQPEIGWGGYDDYLVNNLQLPDEAVLHHIHGEVDLSFQVDPGGKPVDINVVKSLCNPCDAEAVRLLERGPHWKQGTRSKKGRLKVRF